MNAKDRLILELEKKLIEANALIAKLLQRIAELENRLGLDSTNSSKPPSSDGLKKPAPKSLREKTGKTSGGQEGHLGKTLRQVAQPTEKIIHNPTQCPHCATNLQNSISVSIQKRQVFDIPDPKIIVTEHQVHSKICPCCYAKVIAKFPDNVSATVQYGPRVRALAVYLHQQQMIPEDRLQILFKDIFALSITSATLVNQSVKFSEKIRPLTELIYKKLCKAKIKNLDESGLRVATKLHWLHVMSNDKFTHYQVVKKRGDIPRDLSGVIVHDHFKPYYTLKNVRHALCNAHHLRELKNLEYEPWAKAMSKLLKFACHQRNKGSLLLKSIERIHRIYYRIIDAGLAFHENQPSLIQKSLGSKKRRPGHNLLLRLLTYTKDVLRFLWQKDVPFTNNQAEQDIRMIKVKQKISGCFQTIAGAEVFAITRSFLSTMRKLGVNLFAAIMNPDKSYLSICA